MDGGKDTGNAIDEVQFGVTVNMGDIGKIGLSYVDVDNASMDKMAMGVPSSVAELKADSAGMLDKSGLDVRDKTTGKPINGTIVRVAHTINKEAAVLQQVYTDVALTAADNAMGSADYKMAGGKLYASSCLKDGVPITGTGECKAKTWAYVQTMNKGIAEGKVETTHNIFVADSANLANALPTPGTDPVPALTRQVERELTVVKRVDGPQKRVDTEYTLFLPSDATHALSMRDGEKVFMYEYMDTKANDDADDDTPVFAYEHVNSDGESTFYGSDGTLLADLPTSPTNAMYYVKDADTSDEKLVFIADMDGTVEEEDEVDAVRRTDPEAVPETPAGDPTMHTVVHTVDMNTKEMDYGYTQTGVSAQLNLGALTLGLGYSETESNDPMDLMDAKTTYLGASGSIGDTGMGWRAWARNKEDHKGMESSPWGIGLDKALGGGAFTFIEHADADDGASGTTIVALGVNF